MRRVFIGTALAVLVGFAGTAAAQGIKLEVPSGLSLSTTSERAPKKESKPSKGIFKDLRPGSCKVTTNSAPVSSWPARGEPLIAFCRP